MKRAITLGPLETALVITGGNWDAEGVCELVTCFFSDETGFIEANVYGSHNALGRVEGWICAAHFEDDLTLYVQDPEKTAPIASVVTLIDKNRVLGLIDYHLERLANETQFRADEKAEGYQASIACFIEARVQLSMVRRDIEYMRDDS